MKKIIRLTESDLVKLVKRIIKEGGEQPNLTPESKKNLWKQISHNNDLKQHLEIKPHHTEHNFLEELGHKLHIHADHKHINVEFPGLGKQHNISFNIDMPYSVNQSSNDTKKIDYSMKPKSYGSVGVKMNFGGGGAHKQQPNKNLF
jgi:hypothetical protein